MKKILTVYTGGTICSFAQEEGRSLDVGMAKRVIVDHFIRENPGDTEAAEGLFEDSGFAATTLSENMTLRKLDWIIRHILTFDLHSYAGMILLHGTDTLAYSATVLSLLFESAPVPIMLVSANRPPDDTRTNAHVNFRTATELIRRGIAPSVYVPYRNSDGTVWLHFASSILQCANFTDDFYSAPGEKAYLVDRGSAGQGMDSVISDISRRHIEKKKKSRNLIGKFTGLANTVLYISPYVGICYSRISLEGIQAVVHGTFHSGTVCVERNTTEEPFSSDSILSLAKRCEEKGIPLFLAPCVLGREQYSSTYDAVYNGHIVPLDMAAETAYTRAVTGVSCGYAGEALKEFMQNGSG